MGSAHETRGRPSVADARDLALKTEVSAKVRNAEKFEI
jgi:hypothetical protein